MDNKNNLNFSEFQSRERAIAVGKRYLNLFHQLHVIQAGLIVLNKDFIALPDDVIAILPELAGGAKFRQHILNLKSGITPIDKIDADLLPFGEEVFDDKDLYIKYTQYNTNSKAKKTENKVSDKKEVVSEVVKEEVAESLDDENAKVIFELLRKFQNNPKDLEAFKSKEEVRDFGPEWKSKISELIEKSNEKDKSNLKKIFDGLCIFDYALNIWQECVALIKNPKSKSKEDVASKLDEYKKYLNMFGDAGNRLYEKVESLTK